MATKTQLLSRQGLAWGGLALCFVLLVWSHPTTAALVVLANLFGLSVAWGITRLLGLPRDGALRGEAKPDTPRIAGRITPAGEE